VFYNKKSYIGPQCYVNLIDIDNEMKYLYENGFNIENIKVSPYVHIITNYHKEEDNKKYKGSQGSTGKCIAPCAKDKYGRIGIRLIDILNNEDYFKDLTFFDITKHIMNEKLYENILCEGAQRFWLDIDHGNYPYVTSSITLPYSACSLGFPPQKIKIFMEHLKYMIQELVLIQYLTMIY
jgi:adenylosuccinate synthase